MLKQANHIYLSKKPIYAVYQELTFNDPFSKKWSVVLVDSVG